MQQGRSPAAKSDGPERSRSSSDGEIFALCACTLVIDDQGLPFLTECLGEVIAEPIPLILNLILAERLAQTMQCKTPAD